VHVTLVSGVDPTARGASGTRSYVLGLAERLPARNVSVSLVARDGDSAVPGVSYTPIRSGTSSVRFILRLAASAGGLPIPKDSIIHVQRPDDLVAFTFAKRRNSKVCTLHGIPALAVPRRKGRAYGLAYRTLERVGLRRSHRVIAVNAGTAKWYAARYPGLADRMDVIPVAVDTVRFRPMDRLAARAKYGVRAERVVAFAGRLTVEKRVDSVVHAMPDVRGAELLIAGTGPEEARIRSKAHGGAVRLLGAVPHAEMPQFLNAADLLVLASEYEGLPTVAVEALACGVPVVATPVGGLPELVIPGKTGWLVSDLEDLGGVLRDALPRAGTMRDDCVAAARPYAWETVLDRILAVYRKAEAAA